jgi:cytochrome c biogenesis protein CcdA
MLQNINLAFIILPFILAGAAYVKIVNVKTGNAMRDSLHRLKSVTIILGVLFVVLVFLLPTTATISTFRLPGNYCRYKFSGKGSKIIAEV